MSQRSRYAFPEPLTNKRTLAQSAIIRSVSIITLQLGFFFITQSLQMTKDRVILPCNDPAVKVQVKCKHIHNHIKVDTEETSRHSEWNDLHSGIAKHK